MGLDFLQAEDVGLTRLHEGTKAFLQDGAEPVHIPGDQFHRGERRREKEK